MRKNILLRTIFAVMLVVGIGFISFVLTSDFSGVISGRVVSQVYVTGYDSINCSINLKEGLNTVSFFCSDESLTINESMVNSSNQSLDYYAIFKYNPNNPADAWSSYKPNLPDWVTQSINVLERRSGYAVVMNKQGEFFSEGLDFENTKINLNIGWNFIGYPSSESRNISQVLNQIEGKYTRLETYQVLNSSNYWRSYVPGYGGSLQMMEPMVGYWIFMNESAELIIS